MSPADGCSVGILTALGTTSAAWPDELWAGSVSWIDAKLRSYYGVYEFTDDPSCIFRVATEQARGELILADGTHIETGETVGTLHFWNEHVPRYPENGPDLGWARALRDQVEHSLRELAEYIEGEPAWRGIQALHGESAFSARLGSLQIRRVAERYGFERVASDGKYLRRLHALGGNFVAWGLTRAFNPAALARQSFLRDHTDLWMSRTALRQRYLGGEGRFFEPIPQAHGA